MTTRPFPNVVSLSGAARGAYHPITGGRSVYLGCFDDPAAAYRAVLEARAEHFERKAADLRARAEELS